MMTPKQLKVLIVDDHPLILEGVRRTLELDGGFEIVGETEQGVDVLPLIGRVRPDVVLLDLRMPRIDGLTCLDRIRSRYPDVKVVMCSMGSSPAEVQEAFRRGAAGFIVKNISPRDLGAAIRQAVEGTAYHAMGLPALHEQTRLRPLG